MRCLSIIVISALSCACKSDRDAARGAPSAGPLAPVATSSSGEKKQASFEGLYAVDRITRNRSGCESEGPVVEPQVKFYFLRFADSYGHRILTGGGQTNRAKCIRLAKQHAEHVYHPVVFTRALDDAEPKGDIGKSAMPKEGICHSEAEALLLRRTGPGRIRIEIRTIPVDYPGKEMSDCHTTASVKAAVGKPCSELTVIEGHRESELPSGK